MLEVCRVESSIMRLAWHGVSKNVLTLSRAVARRKILRRIQHSARRERPSTRLSLCALDRKRRHRGKAANNGRGAADRRQHCKAAGAVERVRVGGNDSSQV